MAVKCTRFIVSKTDIRLLQKMFKPAGLPTVVDLIPAGCIEI